MRPDDLRQLVHPFNLRLFSDGFLDAHEYDTVVSFDGAIGLQMIDRGNA